MHNVVSEGNKILGIMGWCRMSRYIDADKLTVYFEALAKQAEMEGLYNMAHIHNRCLQIIEDAPSADVVEVVRCKDCKYWDKDNIEQHTYNSEDSTLADFAECTRWSNWSVCRMVRFNDYCSCGERREK